MRTRQIRLYGRTTRGGNPAWRQVQEALEARANFRMASTTGEATRYFGKTGDLPGPWRALFHATNYNYVVASYNTPIAWHDADAGEWVVPEVRYSATTTRHQRVLSTALWAMAEASGRAAYRHNIATGETVPTEQVCAECGRGFDLADEAEASEWHAGHDCEVAVAR
jgi:hypothetical protein